jgi:hypothetical protein
VDQNTQGAGEVVLAGDVVAGAIDGGGILLSKVSQDRR